MFFDIVLISPITTGTEISRCDRARVLVECVADRVLKLLDLYLLSLLELHGEPKALGVQREQMF